MHQLQRDQKLTDIDQFLLYTCWNYVPFASASSFTATGNAKGNQIVQQVYDALLKRLEHAAAQPPPYTPASLTYIFDRCRQLLSIPELQTFDKHANLCLDHLTTLLKEQTAANPPDNALIQATLGALQSFAKTPDLRTLMKNRQLTPLIRQYTSTQNGDQQRLAYGVLAEIMDEKEISNNPGEMTAVFVGQLAGLDPNGHNADVDSALSTLKGNAPI